MRNVLIVSPCFPPVSAADSHRVRMGLPHFASYGWNPIVLAVDERFVEGVQDGLLLKTIPSSVEVHRVRAIPPRWTRKVKLGDLGMRSLAFLYAEGARLLEGRRIELVYFSTTAFTTLPLGRVWKQRFRTPFVVDVQDLWITDYWATRKDIRRGMKTLAADKVHRTLESWTMPEADGLVAVSEDYLTTLVGRYPRLRHAARLTLPFGASEVDFETVRRNPQPNRFFTRDSNQICGVYVGAGGSAMSRSVRMIFQAFRAGLNEQPQLFSRVRLYFIGTSYAPGKMGQETIAPLAAEYGLESRVTETPERVPYFEALQLILDADFLIVPGTDDPQYTASKIFTLILSRKPMLALFHERSSVCEILRRTGAGILRTFGSGSSSDGIADLAGAWGEMLNALPFTPATDWREFAEYSAAEAVRRQCCLFDSVLANRN